MTKITNQTEAISALTGWWFYKVKDTISELQAERWAAERYADWLAANVASCAISVKWEDVVDEAHNLTIAMIERLCGGGES